MSASPDSFRCGTIAVVGRPNVGKSTLVNALVGEKISITSDKPQTTRHRVTGILTRADVQFVFVDTPGFQTRHGGAMNRVLNRTVREVLESVDVVLMVVAAGEFDAEEQAVIKLLPRSVPVFLVVNKTDRLGGPADMLPFLDQASKAFAFAEIVPISALKRGNLEELLKTLRRYLPEQPPMFEEDTLTDRNERFLAAEYIREKLFRMLGEEIPYGCAVAIDDFKLDGRLRRISASIVVNKDNHKAIIIGRGGEKLKAIATGARKDMEKLFGDKVFLEIWVKVREGWIEDAAGLRKFGVDEAI